MIYITKQKGLYKNKVNYNLNSRLLFITSTKK